MAVFVYFQEGELFFSILEQEVHALFYDFHVVDSKNAAHVTLRSGYICICFK